MSGVENKGFNDNTFDRGMQLTGANQNPRRLQLTAVMYVHAVQDATKVHMSC